MSEAARYLSCGGLFQCDERKECSHVLAALDSATMWIFPDGRDAMHIETDQVTMEAESVSIVTTGNMIGYDDSEKDAAVSEFSLII